MKFKETRDGFIHIELSDEERKRKFGVSPDLIDAFKGKSNGRSIATVIDEGFDSVIRHRTVRRSADRS